MPHDFDELYPAHYTSVAAQLYAYCGNKQEAQDLTQEAFCRAYARWRQIADFDDPVAWVRRVAWNLATTGHHRAKIAAAFRRKHVQAYAPPPSPDRGALFAALKALPGRQRQAVVLHYLADQPLADIAESMGVPVGTVKSWLNRARAALATELAHDTTETSTGASHARHP